MGVGYIRRGVLFLGPYLLRLQGESYGLAQKQSLSYFALNGAIEAAEKPHTGFHRTRRSVI